MKGVEFVKFGDCSNCPKKCDVFCVSCGLWFCGRCLRWCVQCEQPACENCCFLEELCCLQRPWRVKIESHLKDFYEKKIVKPEEMEMVDEFINLSGGETEPLNEHRKKVVERSVLRFVQKFDPCGFNVYSGIVPSSFSFD